MEKEELKALVIEKVSDKDWGVVNMTELLKDGKWLCGLNLITSIEDVVEQAEKENVPIITRKYLESSKGRKALKTT